MAGDLVGHPIDQDAAGFLDALDPFPAEQDLFIELARRTGGPDAFDGHVRPVPAQISQNMFKAGFRIAVGLDIQFIQQPAGGQVDQGAFGGGAAAVDADDDIAAADRLRRPVGRDLSDALEGEMEGLRELALPAAVLLDGGQLIRRKDKTVFAFSGQGRGAQGRHVLIIFRTGDRGPQKIDQGA